jgi:uncharacterized membrane protein
MSYKAKGILGIIMGIFFCFMQATKSLGYSRSNGYLVGGILILFGIYRLCRGILQR